MPRNVWKIVLTCTALVSTGVFSGCNSVPSKQSAVSTSPAPGGIRGFVQSKLVNRPAESKVPGDPFVSEAKPVSLDSQLPPATGAGVSLESWVKSHGGTLEVDSATEMLGVNLAASEVSDTDLVRIALEKRPISRVDLSGTDVTDSSVEVLSRIKTLKVLKLDSTDISAYGAAQLSRISSLEFVGLSSTAVSDASLKDLAKLPNLRYLLLDSTSVSNAGLHELENARNLEGVTLVDTEVTEDGVKNLEMILPNCVILWREAKEVSPSTSLPPRPEVPQQTAVPDWAVSGEPKMQTVRPEVLTPQSEVGTQSDANTVFDLDGDWEAPVESPETEDLGADPFAPKIPIEQPQVPPLQDTVETVILPNGLGTWAPAAEELGFGTLPAVTPGRRSQLDGVDSTGFESSVTWSDDRSLFAMIQKSTGQVIVFHTTDVADGQALEGGVRNVKQLRFVDSNRRLIAITANNSGRRTLWEAIVWDLTSGRREESLIQGSHVLSISFVPETTMIVVEFEDGTHTAFDLARIRTGEPSAVSPAEEFGDWNSVTITQ